MLRMLTELVLIFFFKPDVCKTLNNIFCIKPFVVDFVSLHLALGVKEKQIKQITITDHVLLHIFVK